MLLVVAVLLFGLCALFWLCLFCVDCARLWLCLGWCGCLWFSVCVVLVLGWICFWGLVRFALAVWVDCCGLLLLSCGFIVLCCVVCECFC